MTLKEAVEESDKTMTEIASDLGYPLCTLSRYIHGSRNPGLEEKLEINRYFGDMVCPISDKTVELCRSIRGLIKK